MELRPGYKQTEVGVIPEEWDVRSLGDVCVKVQDGTHFSPTIRGGKYLYVTSKNIGLGTLNINDAPHIDEAQHRAIYRRCDPKRGDILLTKDGANTGNAALNTLDEEFSLLSSVVFLRFDPETHHASYFLQHILSHDGQKRIKDEMSGNAITRLTLAKINRLKYPICALPEQRAIATALSDVDALLGALDRLIAKKRDLKQAAMQQLLTGQTRLPGFSGEWELKRLGDHLEFLSNGANSRAELLEDGLVRYLHYGDIHSSKGMLLSPAATAMPFLPEAKAGRLDRLKDGDLVFADASEDLDGVGKSIELQDVGELQVVSGMHTIAVRFEKTVLADGFKAYLQLIPSFRNHLRRLAAGTKVYATNMAHIASAEILLPGTDEQTAIAAVLSEMDAEIAALEARRAKTRDLKQAMMQELLTGRTRLVESNVIALPEQETTSTKRKANVHFVRSVFAAEIIDRLHAEPTFGHVKCQKLIYLAERMCGVDIDSHYHRDAAGPYDNRALRSIDRQLRAQKWFDAQSTGERYRYVPMEKRGGHKAYFDRYFADVGAIFDKVVDALRRLDTERCEIIATLFEAWHDLLARKVTVTDDAILREVLDHWHESKKRIDEDRWRRALGWMREKGFTPQDGKRP